MEIFKTDNLDLAAYLFTKGYEPKIKYKSPIFAEFRYPISVEKLAKNFLQGNVQCNLTKFLYARYALKQLGKKIGSLEEKRLAEDWREKYREFNGQTYWFISDGGLVHSAIFMNTKKHIDRKECGNYYPREDLAVLGAKAKLSTTK